MSDKIIMSDPSGPRATIQKKGQPLIFDGILDESGQKRVKAKKDPKKFRNAKQKFAVITYGTGKEEECLVSPVAVKIVKALFPMEEDEDVLRTKALLIEQIVMEERKILVADPKVALSVNGVFKKEGDAHKFGEELAGYTDFSVGVIKMNVMDVVPPSKFVSQYKYEDSELNDFMKNFYDRKKKNVSELMERWENDMKRLDTIRQESVAAATPVAGAAGDAAIDSAGSMDISA
jgi:hypothetical protein